MKLQIILAAALLASASSQAADLVVRMHAAQPSGEGAYLGTVTITESPHGLVFHPDLKGLAPGVHGFHVHENPSCAAGERDGKPVAGLAAGGHLDPKGTGKHGTPWGDGHLGDLPAMVVIQDGTTAVPLLAPRLKRADVLNRALMIHAGGDNHSDQPEALGGGGARVACGVISG